MKVPSFLTHGVSDDLKRRLKTAADLVGKSRNLDQLEEDLEDSDDELARLVLPVVQDVTDRIDSPPHRRNLRTALVLGLWTAVFDATYREPALELVTRVSRRVVDARTLPDPGPAEDWYVNVTERVDLEDPSEVLDE